MRILRWTALAVAGALAAVAVAPAAAQSVDLKPTQKVKRDKYVLTAEEIAERPDVINAYDAVKLLRPQFLKTTRFKGPLGSRTEGGGYPPDDMGTPPGQSGGSSSGTSAVLYIDEIRQPTVEDMQHIRAADVLEIRYLTGSQASGRYGPDHEVGAILLKTNRLGKG